MALAIATMPLTHTLPLPIKATTIPSNQPQAQWLYPTFWTNAVTTIHTIHCIFSARIKIKSAHLFNHWCHSLHWYVNIDQRVLTIEDSSIQTAFYKLVGNAF